MENKRCGISEFQDMDTVTYKSKIDWWIPVVIVCSVIMCLVGPMIDGDYVAGVVLSLLIMSVEIIIFAGVKYQIRGKWLGVRNFFRWTWYPIDMISEVKTTRSVLSAPALSFDRLAIRFTDKAILKSVMPLEISPKEKSTFISQLKQINPDIKVK